MTIENCTNVDDLDRILVQILQKLGSLSPEMLKSLGLEHVWWMMKIAFIWLNGLKSHGTFLIWTW